MRSWCTSLIKRRGIEGAPGEVHKPHAGGERLLSLPWSLSTVLDAQRSLSLSTLPREPWHKTQVWLNPSSCPPCFAPSVSENCAHFSMDDPPISLPLSHQPPFYSQDVSQMYENILHQPLRIPGGRTVAACDLLQALLHKDQRQRLGSKTDFVGDLPAECWALSLLLRQPRSSVTHLAVP